MKRTHYIRCERALTAIFLLLKFVSTNENRTTTDRKSDFCDLDSSCNRTTTSTATTSIANTIENLANKTNVIEKWKYDIPGGSSQYNETTITAAIDIYRINQTNNGTASSEADLINKMANRSTYTNETKFTNTKYQIQSSDECDCDITKGSCDINCCCDMDCLHVNRDVFQNCVNMESNMEKDEFCTTKILNSPLLCVVKDNLYSRHFYPTHQIAAEAINIDKLLRNREIFGWSFPSLPSEPDTETFTNFKEYEIGSFIWIFKPSKEREIRKFRLPKATVVSRGCENTEPVKFLNDYEETCTYRVREVSASFCESSYSVFNAAKHVENFSIIRNPNSTNLSFSFDCSHNCVKLTPFYCENDDITMCVKVNVSSLATSFNSTSNVCQRVISHVRYNILHNGTEGILQVNVYFQFEDVKLKPNALRAITFKLIHHWFNQTTGSFELSGYPGYVPMKPIITGYRIFRNTKVNNTNEEMAMSNNKKHWLTVFRTQNNGDCLKKQRDNILFRENLYAHCFLKVPKISSAKSCEIFQNEIFDTIFGNYLNISNAYVSTLGKPNIDDKKKWAPFVTDDVSSNIVNETCFGIVTSVKLIILHSSVGEHDNPQQSIIGVKATGKSFERNLSKYENVKISLAVNFYDVTSPPLRIFAEPPTYEVKLPTDFFYPFFSRCSSIRILKILFLLPAALAHVYF